MNPFRRKPKHIHNWAKVNQVPEHIEAQKEGMVATVHYECRSCRARKNTYIYRRRATWIQDAWPGPEVKYIDTELDKFSSSIEVQVVH